MAVCRYDDGRGHPLAFGREMFAALGELHGDKAVWKLMDRLGDEVVEVRVPGPIPRDVDTREDYEACSPRPDCPRDQAAHPGSEPPVSAAVPDIASLERRLDEVDYLADRGLATALFLSLRLPQPLLLEGEAGVGKTEAAKALAVALGTELIRLQCYEGIDAAEALYEWNYPRQLLRIRTSEASGEEPEEQLFAEEFLVPRPLLRAIRHPGPLPAVLLIDELDRADDDFEAFLFELLAESSVTIPELGTVRATHPPAVVLTSNRTRDLHDALKRRCLYHWIDYPSPEREVEIVRRRVPGTDGGPRNGRGGRGPAPARLRRPKAAGIAETIDWVAALELLGVERLDAESAGRTLGSVLKYREDQEQIAEQGLDWLVGADARGD